MRVVSRRMTGVSNCSLMSRATPTRSLASWLSLGSRQGIAGELGVVAVVLLVLRGVHVGIVGGDDDQPGLHAGHRGVEKASAATLRPTCFITAIARLPA